MFLLVSSAGERGEIRPGEAGFVPQVLPPSVTVPTREPKKRSKPCNRRKTNIAEKPTGNRYLYARKVDEKKNEKCSGERL